MAVETRALADELGLTGTHVFFNEGWVDYDDRQNYLLEADIGVSTHFDHVETEFSFRTRILDYFWASLPVVTTGGDALGRAPGAHGRRDRGAGRGRRRARGCPLRAAERRRAGRLVPARVGALADEYRWSRVLSPLIEFCRNPRRAHDLADPRMAALLSSGEPQMGPAIRRWRDYLAVATEHFRRGEYRAPARKTYSRARVIGGRRFRQTSEKGGRTDVALAERLETRHAEAASRPRAARRRHGRGG